MFQSNQNSFFLFNYSEAVLNMSNGADIKAKQNLRQLAFKVAKKCEDLLEYCEYKKDPVTCCDFFKPIYSEQGFCYTFNAKYIGEDDKEWVSTAWVARFSSHSIRVGYIWKFEFFGFRKEFFEFREFEFLDSESSNFRISKNIELSENSNFLIPKIRISWFRKFEFSDSEKHWISRFRKFEFQILKNIELLDSENSIIFGITHWFPSIPPSSP